MFLKKKFILKKSVYFYAYISIYSATSGAASGGGGRGESAIPLSRIGRIIHRNAPRATLYLVSVRVLSIHPSLPLSIYLSHPLSPSLSLGCAAPPRQG